MTKEQLRLEFQRLSFPETIKDINDLADLHLEYLFSVIMKHHADKISTVAERDARMVNQMMFTKIAHAKEIIKGIEYLSKDGLKLNTIIDPTIVAIHIRNIYETVAMFNVVNVQPRNDEEKLVLYNLWVTAGLKYRQSFVGNTSTEENKKKAKNEQAQIIENIRQIEQTHIYSKLSLKNQGKIQTKIQEKDYKIKFHDDTVEFLNWQSAMEITGVKENLMGKMYTYFSLYTHPSNVAVFQFAELFDENKRGFVDMAIFNLRYAFVLSSIYIADYIKVFPNTLKTFNRLPILDQIVINCTNTMARSEAHSINDAVKYLG